MQKVLLLKGIPGCGKSSLCKELMNKEPGKWKRINNDTLRASLDFSEFSKDNELLIGELRKDLLAKFLKKGYNVLIDNLNLNEKHFKDVYKVVEELNIDCQIIEKPLFVDLKTAIERDSKRDGSEKVGEKVIRKWWSASGGKQFAYYKPKAETLLKKEYKVNSGDVDAIIVDLDGTTAIMGNRSPYDASQCDLTDKPNVPVINAIKLYHRDGCKIIFCSGREDKDREPTIRFLKKYLPDYINYHLFMRNTNDKRPDWQVKEEIYFNEIDGKYNVKAVFDDRAQVCRLWFKLNLPIFRVGNPDANF